MKLLLFCERCGTGGLDVPIRTRDVLTGGERVVEVVARRNGERLSHAAETSTDPYFL